MNIEQQIIYLNKKYRILDAEQEYIVHPAAFGLLPLSKASLKTYFSCDFYIKDYHLILEKLTVPAEVLSSPDSVNAEESVSLNKPENCPIPYNGAILIGANPGKEYFMKPGKLACFSYQKVLELVFKNGILTTTVDQSKAMLRIRKNLENDLRSLNNSRDLRCIRHYINSSLVGDYKKFMLKGRRYKYLKAMKIKYN